MLWNKLQPKFEKFKLTTNIYEITSLLFYLKLDFSNQKLKHFFLFYLSIILIQDSNWKLQILWNILSQINYDYIDLHATHVAEIQKNQWKSEFFNKTKKFTINRIFFLKKFTFSFK